MTILHCPQVINENGEHESVSNTMTIYSHDLISFILAMVCERNTGVLHWLSYTTGSMCYHCIGDMYTPYSILGLSGHWKTNGKVVANIDCIYIAMYCTTIIHLCCYRNHIQCVNLQNIFNTHLKKTFHGGA